MIRAQLLIIERIIKTSSTTTSLWWSSQWGSIVPTTITIAQPYLTCLWWSWCWRWRRHWCCRWSPPHYPTIITGPWPELTLMSTHHTEARPSAMKGVALTLGHDCRPFAVWHWAFTLGSVMTIAPTLAHVQKLKIPPSFHTDQASLTFAMCVW